MAYGDNAWSPGDNEFLKRRWPDPSCQHDILSASGGGVRCTKCPGWFCY